MLNVYLGVGVCVCVYVTKPPGSLNSLLRTLAEKTFCCVKLQLQLDTHTLSHASMQLDFPSATTVITQTVKNKPQTLRARVCVCVRMCESADLLLMELYSLLSSLLLIKLNALYVHIYMPMVLKLPM